MPQAIGNFIISLALATGTAGLLPAIGAAALGSAVLSAAFTVGTPYGGTAMMGRRA